MKKPYNKYYYNGEWKVWALTADMLVIPAVINPWDALAAVIAILLIRFVFLVNYGMDIIDPK